MRRPRRYPIGMLVMVPVLGGLAAYTLASGQPLFAGEPTPAAARASERAGGREPHTGGPGGTATATATPPEYIATLTPEERAILYPSPSPTPARRRRTARSTRARWCA